MYGQTEASLRMTYINLTKINKINSIGKPLYGGKLKLLTMKFIFRKMYFKTNNIKDPKR